MSTLLETKFVLIGPYFGKTINLGSLPWRFVNGACTVTANVGDTAMTARFLERNWQAYPENHPAVKEFLDGQRNLQTAKVEDSQPQVPSDLQPKGGGTDAGDPTNSGEGSAGAETGSTELLPDGSGQASQLVPAPKPFIEPTAEVNIKLFNAVKMLDPTNNDHWTKEGKPAVTAVATFYGATDVTRADIDAAYPGFTRPGAK
jgi:hypothetical protein